MATKTMIEFAKYGTISRTNSGSVLTIKTLPPGASPSTKVPSLSCLNY